MDPHQSLAALHELPGAGENEEAEVEGHLAYSDKNLKQTVRKLENALEQLKALSSEARG